MDRRNALQIMTTSTCAALLSRRANGTQSPNRTGLGLVAYCCRHLRNQLRRQVPPADLYAPHRFLTHCTALGAGGMQVPLGVLPADESRSLRLQAESKGMFIEAIISPPHETKDVAHFEAQVKTAAAAGSRAIRTVIIPGRRYEYFNSLDMFRQHEARGRRALELAAPIVEKHRLPLAVENHKDQRDAARVALFEHISSEYVGACVDTGNSLALLEDPIETVRALAPWAHAVHLKDQALQPYDEGFLLGDIPLGQGSFDLRRMVEILRQVKPQIRFSLELLTRDPLKVPVLTDAYWTTFPNLAGRDLARTLRFVRQHSKDQLQFVSKLTPDSQVALENANVRASLDYARDHLGL